MSERVTIVAGSGRCGSSLVMQMLDAAGMAMVGAESRVPAFEDWQWTERWMADPARIEEARGRAVKLLCPMLEPRTFPDVDDVDWIWCSRDIAQQSLSQAKWARAMIGVGDFPIGEVQAALVAERIGILGAIRTRSTHRLLELDFEQLVTRPAIAAQRILTFLELEASARELARIVVPRFPDCYPGLLEAQLVARESA